MTNVPTHHRSKQAAELIQLSIALAGGKIDEQTYYRRSAEMAAGNMREPAIQSKLVRAILVGLMIGAPVISAISMLLIFA